MKKSIALKAHLIPGRLHRCADLEKWSIAVDYHLSQITKDATLEKLSGKL